MLNKTIKCKKYKNKLYKINYKNQVYKSSIQINYKQ